MNFSKIAFSIGFITMIGGMVTKAPLNVDASGSPTVLRFAQGDLGSASQSLSDFNVQGSGVTVAKNTNKGIVMTTGGGQASSVFLKQQLAADASSPGFSTYFVMNVYRLDPGPADGYVFVIAANSSSLGATGGGLGYSSISNSVGIEFDFFNNGGEQMASSDVFQNGNSAFTSGTVFDSGYINQWNSVGTGGLVRAFHTWIEYDHANSRLELRVATSNNESPTLNRPARPATALLTRNTSYSQISNFFYAGFTAGTGGLMQQMSLKSWYMSNAYIAGGINPDANQIVVDSTPPTAPTVQAVESNANQYALTLSGGTDDTGVAGYQYKIPSGNWVNYVSPVAMSTLGEYQARTVDLAGNYSSSVTSIHLYKINFSAGGIIRNSVFRVNTDPSFTVDYEYFDGTNLYRQWYATSGLTGDPITSIAPSTTSITIFGKAINVVTVSYVLNGGQVSTPNPTLYIANTSLVLTEPTKEGHTFSGWFLNAGLTSPYNPNQMPTSNFVLYASYSINSYSVSITLNDDAGTTDNITLPFQTNLGDLLQSWEHAIEENDYVKIGHEFDGWYVNDSFSVAWIAGSTLQADVAIYAKWVALSYQVLYQLPNGDTYSTAVFPYGNSINFPSDPVLYGFTFVGWSDGVNLVANGMTMQANPLTLTAMFSRNNFGLTFQTNSNSILEGYSLPFETRIADYLPMSPVKEGYTFTGWFLDESLTIVFDQNTLLTESTTLYAKWEINAYVLRFETYGGTSIPNLPITYNSPILLPIAPMKEGFTFMGWFEDSSFTDGELPTTMPSQDVTFHASWKVNVYGIRFHIGHGASMDDLRYDFNQSIDAIPTPTVVGYSFLGWFLDESLTTPFNIDNMPASNIELYAKWSVNQYTVSFVSSHLDQPISSNDVAYGEQPNLPTPPARNGYTFLGWRADDEMIDDDWTVPDSDVVLTAVWEGLSSQAIFISPNQTTILNTTSGEPIGSLPTLADKPGFVFLGWSLVVGDASQIVDENFLVENGLTIKLYPIWEKTTNPAIIFNQYLALGFEQATSYTYEIIVFTSMILMGVAGLMIYMKRESYGA